MNHSNSPDRRIPVSVVAGFLGAGKTTFVNHLLSSAPQRFGIIVNEFGKVGVDGSLIATFSDDVQELTQGCLCCTGQDDLIKALVTLTLRSDDERPQHILVELSGLADPAPILYTLLDPDVRSAFRLDGLITVVDALQLIPSLRQSPETGAQLAYASAVIINKTDLVTPSELAEVQRIISGLQPLASQVCAERSQVGAQALLSLHAFCSDWAVAPPAAQHTPNLKTLLLEHDQPLSLEAWQALAQRIVSRPAQVLRVKGPLSLRQSPQPLMLHAVRDLVSLDPLPGPATGHTQLVIIGRDLDPVAEREAFAALCRLDAGPVRG